MNNAPEKCILRKIVLTLTNYQNLPLGEECIAFISVIFLCQLTSDCRNCYNISNFMVQSSSQEKNPHGQMALWFGAGGMFTTRQT
jgi:hypothetical protein